MFRASACPRRADMGGAGAALTHPVLATAIARGPVLPNVPCQVAAEPRLAQGMPNAGAGLWSTLPNN